MFSAQVSCQITEAHFKYVTGWSFIKYVFVMSNTDAVLYMLSYNNVPTKVGCIIYHTGIRMNYYKKVYHLITITTV